MLYTSKNEEDETYFDYHKSFLNRAAACTGQVHPRGNELSSSNAQEVCNEFTRSQKKSGPVNYTGPETNVI